MRFKGLFFLIVNSLFLGCAKDSSCEAAFDAQTSSDFIEVNSMINSCLKSDVKLGDEFVIRTEEELLSHFDLGCEKLPVIDFENYTLLGVYAEGGGCQIIFQRKIIKQASQYRMMVLISTSGNCKMLGFSYNWILVPKIPENSSVSFELIQC